MNSVYIVRRNDGQDLDIFAEYYLADRWAAIIGAKVEEEGLIDRETFEQMKKHQGKMLRGHR